MQVVLGPYLDQRGLSEGLIGTVVVAYGAAALAARLGSGVLYRSRRAPWLVAGGCVTMAIGFAALPLTGNPLVIALLLALDGGGYGVATTAGLAAVLERQPHDANAGAVMGWYTGATGAGYALAGFLGGPLADAVGIRPAILVIALLPATAGVLLLGVLRRSQAVTAATAAIDGPIWSVFRRVPAPVWLSFGVAFYLALVNGGVFTFFPIHGLAIGLTLTQVGALAGIHGATATGIRFLSGPLFRVVDYRRSLPVMVVVNATAVAVLSLTGAWVLLAVAWGTIGLTRGVLRVASGALVMDAAGESDRARGAASTVYLAGLDVGKILGPPIAGVTAELVGLRTMFLVVGVAFASIYAVSAALVRARERSVAP
ncbi:MAG: MFS transporter, partial [Nitriliruptorales bacterium]